MMPSITRRVTPPRAASGIRAIKLAPKPASMSRKDCMRAFICFDASGLAELSTPRAPPTRPLTVDWKAGRAKTTPTTFLRPWICSSRARVPAAASLDGPETAVAADRNRLDLARCVHLLQGRPLWDRAETGHRTAPVGDLDGLALFDKP